MIRFAVLRSSTKFALWSSHHCPTQMTACVRYFQIGFDLENKAGSGRSQMVNPEAEWADWRLRRLGPDGWQRLMKDLACFRLKPDYFRHTTRTVPILLFWIRRFSFGLDIRQIVAFPMMLSCTNGRQIYCVDHENKGECHFKFCQLSTCVLVHLRNKTQFWSETSQTSFHPFLVHGSKFVFVSRPENGKSSKQRHKCCETTLNMMLLLKLFWASRHWRDLIAEMDGYGIVNLSLASVSEPLQPKSFLLKHWQ